MVETLKYNHRIVINSDIDGIISGLLLSNFCNCEVVGFSNSADRVWLDTSRCKSIFEPVYIDMFVANESTVSIDQHIIAVNQQHADIIKLNKNKINPNIDNPRFLKPNSSYTKKYPFGTCHYIMAMLCGQGIDISDIDLKTSNYKLTFLDYLLRADDAMNTSLISYKDNAKEWWDWLLEFSNHAETLSALTSYLYSTSTEKATKIKLEITRKLKDEFKCDRPDGGVIEITDEMKRLKQHVIDYIQFIAHLAGLKCFSLDLKLDEFKGTNLRLKLTDEQQHELIQHGKVDGKKIFSYAFVRTSDRAENFSYTIMDE